MKKYLLFACFAVLISAVANGVTLKVKNEAREDIKVSASSASATTSATVIKPGEEKAISINDSVDMVYAFDAKYASFMVAMRANHAFQINSKIWKELCENLQSEMTIPATFPKDFDVAQ